MWGFAERPTGVTDDGPRGLGEEYRAFVGAHPGATLWHDADFLDCLAAGVPGGALHFADLREGAALRGVLPFFLRRRFGLSQVIVPPLARYAPPLVDAEVLARDGAEASAARLLDRVRAISRRGTWLPPGPLSLDLAWAPSTLDSDAWPTALAGFRCAMQPTYRINLVQPPQSLRAGLSRSMRKRIKRAEGAVRIERGPLTTDDLALLAAPFARQRLALPFSVDVVADALALLAPQGRAIGTRATDAAGELLGVSVLLLDRHAAYAWVSASTEHARELAVGSYLLWSEVGHAHDLGLGCHDFLGSALPGAAANRRALGGELCHYPTWSSESVAWRALSRWRRRGGAEVARE